MGLLVKNVIYKGGQTHGTLFIIIDNNYLATRRSVREPSENASVLAHSSVITPTSQPHHLSRPGLLRLLTSTTRINPPSSRPRSEANSQLSKTPPLKTIPLPTAQSLLRPMSPAERQRGRLPLNDMTPHFSSARRSGALASQ
jgi:hypothetical protein